MPNWCDTTYKCVGDTKEVRALHKVLKYIDRRKTTIVRNGFGKWWLGNLVTKLGGKWEDYRCRGEIIDYSLDGDILIISQSTAWSEQEGVRRIIQEKFPSIKVYYREEEPGCGVYYTNDTTGDYFPETYFLDSYNEQLYFETIEEAAECVSGIVGCTVEATIDAIQEALEKYVEQKENSGEEAFYSFHEFKVIDD
jgi:predicted RNase H-like HicB family nuclease